MSSGSAMMRRSSGGAARCAGSPTAAIAALFLAGCLAGCGSARQGAPFDEPIRFREGKLRAGHILFMRECNQCHPQGGAGLAPSLNEKPIPGLAMRAQVRQGFGAMPAFSEEELNDEALDAIIAYLNELQAMEGP